MSELADGASTARNPVGAVRCELANRERDALSAVAQRSARIQCWVERECPLDDDVDGWFVRLSDLKAIQGNLNNDISLLACLLAKRYLVGAHGALDLDVAAKPQGAPGLDFDVPRADGRRIVAELKTTVPYGAKDFGAQQKQGIRDDLEKLQAAVASFKYMFVTDERAFRFVRTRFADALSFIEVVLLRPATSADGANEAGSNGA